MAGGARGGGASRLRKRAAGWPHSVDASPAVAGRVSVPGRRAGGQTRRRDNEGIIPVLAMAVREVERAVNQRQLTSGQRARFQAAALLARAERANVRGRRGADAHAEGVAAQAAGGPGHDPGPDRHPRAVALQPAPGRRRDLRRHPAARARDAAPGRTRAGARAGARPDVLRATHASAPRFRSPSSRPSWPTRSWCPTSARPHRGCTGRLAGWELIEPLLNSFEQAAAGGAGEHGAPRAAADAAAARTSS